MFRIEDIKNNDDYVVFFKIIEKKYINNFLKEGQVYFGLLDDYRKMDMIVLNLQQSCEAVLDLAVYIASRS